MMEAGVQPEARIPWPRPEEPGTCGDPGHHCLASPANNLLTFRKKVLIYFRKKMHLMYNVIMLYEWAFVTKTKR